MSTSEKLSLTVSLVALLLSSLNTLFVYLDRQDRAQTVRSSYLTELNNETREFFNHYLEYAGNTDRSLDEAIHRKLTNQSILISAIISRAPKMHNTAVRKCLDDLAYRVGVFAERPDDIRANWELAVAEDLDQFFNLPGELAIEYYANDDLRSNKGDDYFLPKTEERGVYNWHCVERS